MKKLAKYVNVVLVLVCVLQRNSSVQSATLDQNGYTLNIAISNQVDRIPEEERASFLQTLQVKNKITIWWTDIIICIMFCRIQWLVHPNYCSKWPIIASTLKLWIFFCQDRGLVLQQTCYPSKNNSDNLILWCIHIFISMWLTKVDVRKCWHSDRRDQRR